MRAFYSDHFVLPLPDGHKFPMAKYAGLRERILAEGIVAPSDLHEAPAASLDDLRLVHHADYVDAVVNGTVAPDIQRRIGFPWSPEMVATLASFGRRHHRGEGFCVFNDVAVAARVLQRDQHARRIAVVDLDVHQGNGTLGLRDEMVLRTCARAGLPVAISMSGGYANDIDAIVTIHANTILTASRCLIGV